MSAPFAEPRFRLSGDRGLLVELGEGIDPEVNRRVRALFMALEQDSPSWLVEAVPTYRSLLILYDPAQAHPDQIRRHMLELRRREAEIEIPPPEVVEIPVCYGGELGPDLEYVAECHGLSPEEVVSLHSRPDYQIYMIGFTPGFPFLGGLPEELHTPRRESPRSAVPAGSVGIANAQTGIYPVTSPGGWQIVGRTPLNIFDPRRENPFLLKAGDLLRFRPISRQEYDSLLEREEG